MTTRPAAPNRRSFLIKAVVAIAVLCLLLFGWRKCSAAQEEESEWDQPPTAVRITPAVQEDLVVRLKALGTVTPLQTVTLRSRVDGELVRLAFQEGQQVKAGDLLAEIDPRSFKVQLAQAQGQQKQNMAELDNAQGQLNRFRELQSKHFVSAQDLSDQQARVRQFQGRRQSDQAAVDEAQLQLQYTRITAPVSGRMGLRNVDVGNLVRSGDEEGIATITQLSPISVLFTLPESELPAVIEAMRQDPQLKVEAWDREERKLLATGTLASLDNRIDTSTGTLKLRALFQNTDESLFPNQFTNIRLQVSSANSVVIPNAAVQFGSKGTYVYVIGDDDTSSMRPVVLGAADGERVAVREGLKPGERVVLEGLDRLREGSKVEVVTGTTGKDGAEPEA